MLKIGSMGNISFVFLIYLSELVKAIKDVFKIFKKSETPFSTVNSYNFRDITFEKVRYMDIKI